MFFLKFWLKSEFCHRIESSDRKIINTDSWKTTYNIHSDEWNKKSDSFLARKHFNTMNDEKKIIFERFILSCPWYWRVENCERSWYLSNFNALRKMRSTLILSLFLMTIVTVHGTYELGRLKKLLQRKSLNVRSSEPT